MRERGLFLEQFDPKPHGPEGAQSRFRRIAVGRGRFRDFIGEGRRGFDNWDLMRG